MEPHVQNRFKHGFRRSYLVRTSGKHGTSHLHQAPTVTAAAKVSAKRTSETALKRRGCHTTNIQKHRTANHMLSSTGRRRFLSTHAYVTYVSTTTSRHFRFSRQRTSCVKVAKPETTANTKSTQEAPPNVALQYASRPTSPSCQFFEAISAPCNETLFIWMV